jgi:cystathionine gamma-lyase
MKQKIKLGTKAIHVGAKPNFRDGGSGDVVVPIHLSTTFARKKVSEPTGGYEYSRSGNPTRYALEKNMAFLENGKYGFAFSSGLSAITSILFLLKPGDHVISIDDVYGGTRRLFTQVFEQFGIIFSFINFTSGAELGKNIQNNTKMIWIESPTNPLLKIIDIKSAAKTARPKGILTVVDNTFATPFFQSPLDLGADIVVHSATKYLGGHSDSVAGSIVVNSKELSERIKFIQNAVGAILSPFDSYMILRGIKTLKARMDLHEKNAFVVSNFLQKHKRVLSVYYPGLSAHPGHKIAKKQMRGFGGIISFEINGDRKQTIKFLESLRLIHVAESLGAVESLIEHPSSMTHSSISKNERKKIGITENLVRLSVGIEESGDLIEDLDQALRKSG